MKRHPYRESYLDEIAETQGAMFEGLQDASPDVDGMDFIRRYMKSETRAFIDHGDAYLATLGPSLLMEYYRSKETSVPKPGNPIRGFAPNWMGRFYAHYQWETGTPSGDIVEVISPEWLHMAYSGLHDLDMRLAVEKVVGEIRKNVAQNEN